MLTSDFAALAGLLGVRVRICRPADPEAKGLVERANGYLETSFLPGRVFSSPDDFNAQLGQWLERANRRWHRRLEARPADRWDADLARMVALPPVSPPAWWRSQVRIGRDHWARVDTNDYSVHPQAICRTVQVTVTAEQVTAAAGTTVVARRDRCWARHQTVTDPDHAAAAAVMRGRAALAGRPPRHAEVETRDLASYDRAFKVIDGGAAS